MAYNHGSRKFAQGGGGGSLLVTEVYHRGSYRPLSEAIGGSISVFLRKPIAINSFRYIYVIALTLHCRGLRTIVQPSPLVQWFQKNGALAYLSIVR